MARRKISDSHKMELSEGLPLYAFQLWFQNSSYSKISIFLGNFYSFSDFPQPVNVENRKVLVKVIIF